MMTLISLSHLSCTHPYQQNQLNDNLHTFQAHKIARSVKFRLLSLTTTYGFLAEGGLWLGDIDVFTIFFTIIQSISQYFSQFFTIFHNNWQYFSQNLWPRTVSGWEILMYSQYSNALSHILGTNLSHMISPSLIFILLLQREMPLKGGGGTLLIRDFFGKNFGQNSNPCTGSSILGSLILGYSVWGSSVLGLRNLGPWFFAWGSLVLESSVQGLRILNPRTEDPQSPGP